MRSLAPRPRPTPLLLLALAGLLLGCSGEETRDDPTPAETTTQTQEEVEPVITLKDREVQADQYYKDEENVVFVRFLFRDGMFAGNDAEGRVKVPPIKSLTLEPSICGHITWVPLRQETDHFGEMTVSSGPFMILKFAAESIPEALAVSWAGPGGQPNQTIRVRDIPKARETNNLFREYALYKKNIEVASEACASKE